MIASSRAQKAVIAVTSRARPKLRPANASNSLNGSAAITCQPCTIHRPGISRQASGGSRVTPMAAAARQPVSGHTWQLTLPVPRFQRRLRRLKARSAASSRITMARAVSANRAAPLGSPSICQRFKIPADRLGTPSNLTAPNSFTTSMALRATPAPIEGAASGKATRQKLCQGPTPKLRQASSSWRPLIAKLSVLSKNT